MTSTGRHIVLAGLAAWIGAASGAQAQTQAQTQAPAKGNDLSQGVPSKEALSRKTALKLAGLSTFVASSCRELRLDPARFRTALAALGLTAKELDEEATKFAYLQYTMAYRKDVPANCARARTEFGPNGRTLPDLFVVVAPPAAPSPPSKSPDSKSRDGKTP